MPSIAGRQCQALLFLLFAVPLHPGLQAQVTIGLGRSYEHHSTRYWSFGLTGTAVDLSVRASPVIDIIGRAQVLKHDEFTEVDPIAVYSIEAGLQYVPTRGKLVQVALGFGFGAYLRNQYDSGSSGANIFGRARIGLYPVRWAGLFVDATGRGFGGGGGGTGAGLTLGVSLGVNH